MVDARTATPATWAAEPLPGPPVDSYGCGDSFAAGLTYGLGAGMPVAAAQLGARCGAHCLTGRGPYARSSAAAEAAQEAIDRWYSRTASGAQISTIATIQKQRVGDGVLERPRVAGQRDAARVAEQVAQRPGQRADRVPLGERLQRLRAACSWARTCSR